MYLEIVKRVLDQAVARYGVSEGLSRKEICKRMGEHLQEMTKQHREEDPSIPYDDPLCRLAYVYKHVAANATLFERALGSLETARAVVKARAGGTLHVCAVGGGPGSELLGLMKFIVERGSATYLPRRIEFTIIDLVPEWGETWTQLAREVETSFATGLDDLPPPVIVDKFYPFDATKEAKYKSFGWLLSEVDLFVFNYIISENLDNLDHLAEALRILAGRARDDAAFVFIDRKEYSDRINKWLVQVLPTAGFELVGDLVAEGGCLDRDEQVDADLHDYPALIGQGPRVKFFTPGNRNPTAFFLAARRVN